MVVIEQGAHADYCIQTEYADETVLVRDIETCFDHDLHSIGLRKEEGGTRPPHNTKGFQPLLEVEVQLFRVKFISSIISELYS